MELASISTLHGASAGVPGIEDWSKANILKTPLGIYDINGKLLFLDYTVKRGRNTLGAVRMGANKILGSPVISYELGPRFWNFGAAVKKIMPRVKKKYPKHKIPRPKLVCYSYPKLGVMFVTVGKGGERKRLIFDIADLSLIPEKAKMPDTEGAFAWSFYDTLQEPVRKARLKQYEKFDEWRQEMPKKVLTDLKKTRTLKSFEGIKWPLPFLQIDIKKLQFCSHYNYNETRSHHCFVLHGQQKNDYCAVATAQMILDYYRYYYSQNDIAPALGYGPGGCPADQSGGYEDLSCNHIDATYDTTTTWEKARDQIKKLRPLKSGVPGHARACAGYWYFKWGSITQKKLYIYDPWPWNGDYKLGGSVYWEDWDSITHTNFIYTRLHYNPCPP